MPSKGSSLASLLGTLTNAAPVDFDPEAPDAEQPGPSTFANGSDADSQDDEDDDDDQDTEEGEAEEEEYMNPRAHYADVGKSDMRKKAAVSESAKIQDPRYQGVKSSRAELYADDDDDEDEDDQDEGEEDDDDDDVSGQDEDSEPETKGEDSREDDGDIPAKAKKQLRFAENDASSATDDDVSEEEAPAQASTSNSIAAQIAQSASQGKALKARRIEDAEKGRAVRKQIKTYERTLETRIKAQSVLRDVNRLPDPSIYSDIVSASTSSMEPAIVLLEQLLELSETLFSLRTRLNTLSSSSDQDPDDTTVVSAPATRKRKRDFDVTVPEDEEESAHTWTEIVSHDQIDATLSDITTFSHATEPYRRSVLDKWSLKVTSAANAASANGNKFTQLRAVNQTPSSQIDSALAGDGLDRLLSRTRVVRSDLVKLGSQLSPSDEVHDAEVFDDSDFYSTLLKELIERRSSSIGGSIPTTSAMMLSGLQGKKKKANVDTKASKGRKLRYEVHEKLVNFMPPIGDRLKWGEEQIERLFRQLASTGVVQTDGESEGEEDPGDQQAALDGLRVFG